MNRMILDTLEDGSGLLDVFAHGLGFVEGVTFSGPSLSPGTRAQG